MNKLVMIKTKNGTYRGKIVKVDKQKVYLKVSSIYNGKKMHISFFPLIIPLVLFDLLAIVLITQPRRRIF